MRASKLLKPTLKESPADAVVISHQLMLRAGLIRKLASGLYTWLPLGLRVLRKVEKIVREEMDAAGAQELLMPVVQPAELWQETERWEQFGPQLLRITDRHQRDFCLGPTHEEVITDLMRNELTSYKQLPAIFYQIQTKFRDEIRPRFGIMRAREFTMKDAYSFHIDQDCLQKTYDQMHTAYSNIFNRIGLNFRPVMADTGSIGGSNSHEFHVLAESGEDDIAFSDTSDFAANIEKAEAIAPTTERPKASQPLTKVATPNAHTIEDVAQCLSVDATCIIKTLIVLGETNEDDSPQEDSKAAPLIALILRGDHQLNEVKAEKISGIQSPLQFASDDDIERALGCKTGSIGPINLPIPMIIDHSAAHLADFVCGANKDGYHYTGASWCRDVAITDSSADESTQNNTIITDIRNVVTGDPSPDGKGTITIKRGIEVGHIFQLGQKYAKAMKATVLSDKGKAETMTMGCYGIGVSRVVAATIEQNNDENGIIWPMSIAPFTLAIVPINPHKSEAVKKVAEELYNDLTSQGHEVLYMDEVKARLGVMLSDVELMGIPHRVVIGDRGLKEGNIEYKGRRDSESQDIPTATLNSFLAGKLNPS